MSKLKVGDVVELVEILPHGETYFTPIGSQRVVYPEHVALANFNGIRMSGKHRYHAFDSFYVMGHGINGDRWDVYLFKAETKPIGRFIVKSLKHEQAQRN